MPTRSSRTIRASAASWTRSVRSVSTRTPTCSGRPTTAPGRMSIQTPDIRRSAAPKGTVREGGNRVPSLAWGPNIKTGYQEFRHRRRPRLHGDLCSYCAAQNCRIRTATGQAYHLRQLRHVAGLVRHWQVARATSWFYFTENELTPGAARVVELQGRVQPARRRRRQNRRARGRLQSRLEGAGDLCRHRAAGVRPVAGPAGTLRHLHEQLHGTHLGHGHHQ